MYVDTVLKMEVEFKDTLLLQYKLINEGELFCSDFKYRFTSTKNTEYIG